MFTAVANTSKMADTGSTIFVWLIVGLVALWFIGHLGKLVERQVMPSVPFLVGAGFVGIVAMAALSKIF